MDADNPIYIVEAWYTDSSLRLPRRYYGPFNRADAETKRDTMNHLCWNAKIRELDGQVTV